MSIPLLATGRSAATPYSFTRLSLRIWSVEELCHLIKTNPFILDATILDRKLVTWLETACDLPELGRLLALLLKRKADAEAFVMAILEYTGYLDDGEVERVAAALGGNVGLTDYEREIKRIDFLLSGGKYQLAIREYDRIMASLPSGERLLSGRILHNRAVALARMFAFDEAAKGFFSAYELGGRPESARAYLTAVRLTMDAAEYVRFIADHPSFRDFSLEVEHIYIQALNDYNGTDAKGALDDLIAGRAVADGGARHAEEAFGEGIDRIAVAAKEDYRRSAGNV